MIRNLCVFWVFLALVDLLTITRLGNYITSSLQSPYFYRNKFTSKKINNHGVECGRKIKQVVALYQCLMRIASPAIEYPGRKGRSYVIDYWPIVYVNQIAIFCGFRNNYSSVEHIFLADFRFHITLLTLSLADWIRSMNRKHNTLSGNSTPEIYNIRFRHFIKYGKPLWNFESWNVSNTF